MTSRTAEDIVKLIEVGTQRHAWFYRNQIVLNQEEADHVCWVCGRTPTNYPLETCPTCRQELQSD